MGNVLYINKPSGISSFDVCFKLRKVLGTKKIGHTGTLDPNATGVMVVLYENGTKANQFLVTDTKEYIAKVKLGIETDTLDIVGNIVKEEKCIMPNKETLIDCLNSFLGESKQVVPITSAVKVDGKRLYRYQLENKQVELPIRDINVYEIELLEIGDDYFTFRSKVSSGTYIRALMRDILAKLNLVGTLQDLKRTYVDTISINECDRLEDVLNGNYTSRDIYDILKRKYVTYNVTNKEDVVNGKRIKIDSNEEKLLMVYEDKVLAMYQKDGSEYKCLRGLL